MKELVIKNGSFYRGSEKVEIEIGNKEQIECLKKHNEFIEDVKDGVEVDIDEVETITKYEINIKCLCGATLNREYEQGHLDDDPIDEFNGMKVKCFRPACDKEYLLFQRAGELYYKLKQ